MSIYPPILTVSAVFLLTACAVSEPHSYEQTSRTAQGKVESMVTDTMPYRHRATLASAQLDSRPAVIQQKYILGQPMDEKQMQDALFEAEEKLQQVQKDFERMKDEFQDFIYVVSHDLRGPLRHASGFGEMLLDMNESVLDEKSKKFLNIIIDSAEGGKRSIDSLQKYSRLIFNVQAPEDNINPNGILDDIAASMNMPRSERATISCRG